LHQSRADIKGALGISSVSEVSRLLRFAEDNGILLHVINEGAASWSTDPELGSGLQARFDLLSAYVVAFPADVKYGEEVDDTLHYQLGKAAATWLRDSVRDDDTILTVGGRTPFYIAKGLETLPERPKAKNVRVVPVTGAIGATMWTSDAPESRHNVDAVEAAFEFTRTFGGAPIGLHLPGALDDAQEMRQARAIIHELVYGADDRYRPSIAICGVGRLAGGHALLSALRDRSSWHRHPLRPVISVLMEKASIREAAKSQKPMELPYGDLANRLFPLGDLPQDQQMLTTINNCIVGISMVELARVPVVLLCAGGDVKYLAIRRVLGFLRPDGNRRLIRVLVTDAVTAQKLLDASSGSLPTMDISQLPGE
jgi:DNA-binding transcriptional regulator LsrR (DeoR family)